MSRSAVRRAGAAATALALAAGLTGCVPDTTRGRVEHDVAATFSNQYAQSQQLQGKPARRPAISSTECHSSVNTKIDAGPGGWPCEIKYTDIHGKPQDDNFLVLIDALGCYQAFNVDDAKRYRMITDVHAHKKVVDPAGGFDGCYDVFDNRTRTSKR
jgi:hypothetical protein